jgi:ribosomal protein L30/L7E
MHLHPAQYTYGTPRVIITTVRSLGLCPCPRCCIEKDDIPDVGSIPDMRKREHLRRSDTAERRGMIEKVREWIYRGGSGVASAAVNAVLQAKSWVPTRVRCNWCYCRTCRSNPPRMPFQVLPSLDLTSTA